MWTLGRNVFFQIDQLPLPFTTRFHVGTLDLETLDVSTAPFVRKGARSFPTVWTVELPVTHHLLLPSSVVLHAPLAVDSATAGRLVGMVSD